MVITSSTNNASTIIPANKSLINYHGKDLKSNNNKCIIVTQGNRSIQLTYLEILFYLSNHPDELK